MAYNDPIGEWVQKRQPDAPVDPSGGILQVRPTRSEIFEKTPPSSPRPSRKMAKSPESLHVESQLSPEQNSSDVSKNLSHQSRLEMSGRCSTGPIVNGSSQASTGTVRFVVGQGSEDEKPVEKSESPVVVRGVSAVGRNAVHAQSISPQRGPSQMGSTIQKTYGSYLNDIL